MEKLVSVVTSVYNKAEYLHRFFKSVMSQSYSNIEVVCIDNASTDSSLQLLRQYADVDARIKVFCINVNKGPSDGLLHAFNNAAGDYITVIDADDYIDSDYIEKLVGAIERENADVAMCLNDMVWDDGRTSHKDWPEAEINVIEGDRAKSLVNQLLDERSYSYFGFPMPEIGGVWNKLYRRGWLESKGIQYESGLWKWCDFLFNVKVMKQVNKLVYINNAIYHFYQSDVSTTRLLGFDSDFFPKQYTAANRIFEEVQNYQVPNIMNAFSVFAFRITRDFCNYYQSQVGNSITNAQFTEAISALNSQPFFKALRRNIMKTGLSGIEKILVLSLSFGSTKLYSAVKIFCSLFKINC